MKIYFFNIDMGGVPTCGQTHEEPKGGRPGWNACRSVEELDTSTVRTIFLPTTRLTQRVRPQEPGLVYVCHDTYTRRQGVSGRLRKLSLDWSSEP